MTRGPSSVHSTSVRSTTRGIAGEILAAYLDELVEERLQTISVLSELLVSELAKCFDLIARCLLSLRSAPIDASIVPSFAIARPARASEWLAVGLVGLHGHALPSRYVALKTKALRILAEALATHQAACRGRAT